MVFFLVVAQRIYCFHIGAVIFGQDWTHGRSDSVYYRVVVGLCLCRRARQTWLMAAAQALADTLDGPG